MFTMNDDCKGDLADRSFQLAQLVGRWIASVRQSRGERCLALAPFGRGGHWVAGAAPFLPLFLHPRVASHRL